jgi:hypothetical protein
MRRLANYCVLFLAVFFVSDFLAGASVRSYDVFKTLIYHQDGMVQPTALDFPQACFLGAQLFSDDKNSTGNSHLRTPNGRRYPMTYDYPGCHRFHSRGFTSSLEMDSAFQSGVYRLDAKDGTDFGDATFPKRQCYSKTVPFFTGPAYSAMKQVNPSQPLPISWNAFVPDSTSTSSFVFVRLIDPTTGVLSYIGNFLSPQTTGLVIPPKTLAAGVTYRVELVFSSRVEGLEIGFDGKGACTIGFDTLTYTSLTTTSERLDDGGVSYPQSNAAQAVAAIGNPFPGLTIVATKTEVILSWPITPGDYSLEATSQMSGGDPAWNRVVERPTEIGGRFILAKPIIDNIQLFRLKPN